MSVCLSICMSVYLHVCVLSPAMANIDNNILFTVGPNGSRPLAAVSFLIKKVVEFLNHARGDL